MEQHVLHDQIKHKREKDFSENRFEIIRESEITKKNQDKDAGGHLNYFQSAVPNV
ncbi:MAG TPA: hypothetical protein PLS50_00930 [Candidatus Dojkabacteria bacterium]|nr:hypothetical protein [Candidatus Dojkabacteria bacterium]